MKYYLLFMLISFLTFGIFSMMTCQNETTTSKDLLSEKTTNEAGWKYEKHRDSLILAKESQLNKTVTDRTDYPYYAKYKLVETKDSWIDARTGFKIEVREILPTVPEEFLEARFAGKIQYLDTTITANKGMYLGMGSFDFQYKGDYYNVFIGEVNWKLGYVMVILAQRPPPVDWKK